MEVEPISLKRVMFERSTEGLPILLNMRNAFHHWLRYEVKVWRHAWSRTGVAIQRLWSSTIGAVLTAIAGLALAGAALEYKTALPVLVALGVAVLTLAWNLALAPMRIDREAADTLETERKKNDDLSAHLARRQLEREQYEALRPLLDVGHKLVVEGDSLWGDASYTKWTDDVAGWRKRVYEALPVERDAFLTISPPAVFAAADSRKQRVLLEAQVGKLRKIMMRLESGLDGRGILSAEPPS